jgi:adenylosuccinate lyase
MIERYTLPEMAAVWCQSHRYQTWLQVELAVVKVYEGLDQVPAGTAAHIEQSAQIDPARIDAIEAEVKHDIIAFLTHLGESVGEASRHIHLGMTSSDLVDTAQALQIQAAGQLILDKLASVIDTLRQQANTHRHTVMVGRSHGVHGEPITLGIKLLNWVDTLERQQTRLSQALDENRIGQFSGPMGTYSNIEPDIELKACALLGLKPARISTQVIARDIPAQYVLALAQLASSIEQFAVELRHLQRTEVLEAEEPFTTGQKGSSAMPHKRNPVSGENLTGLARLVRGAALPMLENIALWHERDISHSSVDRVVLPDVSILMHYMLNRFNQVMVGLQVYPQNMAANLNRFGGVVFSQKVLLTLVEAELSREAAYSLVQRNAMAAWNQPNGDFKANLLADSEVLAKLSPEAIAACFDPQAYLHHVDTIFSRFGL